MSTNNGIWAESKKLWDQTSLPARGIIITTAVCAAAIIGVGYWSSLPSYVPFAEDLTLEEAYDVISKLEDDGIAAKLNYAGNGVQVDQSQVSRARLVVRDVVQPGQLRQHAEPSGLLDDPGTRKDRLARDLEWRLSQTIAQLKPVNKAWVHLGLPDKQVFSRQQKPKTASVVIELGRGESFSTNLSRTITQLVSSSVEGMQSEAVTISDTNGNTFTGDGSDPGGITSRHLEYRKFEELDRARKAQRLLDNMLGPGRATVEVAADIDFTQITSTTERVDPDGTAKKVESIQSTKETRRSPRAVGAAGTASNINRTPVGASNDEVMTENEIIDIEYDNPINRETRIQHPGAIKRLTIAAMVQLTDHTGDDPAAATAANSKPKATLQEIEELIKQAVGFSETRKDKITVMETEFALETSEIAELIAAPTAVDSWSKIVRNASLGIAALVALLLGFLTLRRIRPITVERENQTNLTPERARQISDLVSLVQQHPEMLSKVMSAWINDGNSKSADSESSSNRRAA